MSRREGLTFRLGSEEYGVNDVVRVEQGQICVTPALGMNDGCEMLSREVATIGDRNQLLTDVASLLNARGQIQLETVNA